MARKPARRTTPAAAASLVLNEVLDLSAAAPLQADLLSRRGQDLAVDASATQRLGGQCLQVLLAAQATWATDGLAFRIAPCSPAFREAASLLGAPDLAAA